MYQDEQPLHIPSGYRFSGFASGVKESGNADLSLLVADQNCFTLGAFTQNVVRASCVDWNSSHIGTGRALVINSGNANACTGSQGAQDTIDMASRLASRVGAKNEECYVMSTGIIGEVLPMIKVMSGIDAAFSRLGQTEDSVKEFAAGILTTDSFAKIRSQKFSTPQGDYSIMGIAKGAGMIGPKMATMLCVVVTDFPLGSFAGDSASEEENGLKSRFLEVINRTFNSISVDGHTSTSDQVILFSNAEQNAQLSASDLNLFFEHLEQVSRELAKMIPADGEGAKHLITVEVNGRFSGQELRSVAKTVVDSPLVKTAVFGADPNWGRIVSAAGYNGLRFDPTETSLWVNGFLLYENGTPVQFDAAKVSSSMRQNFETQIKIDLSKNPQGNGDHSEMTWNTACFWGSDLTYDYVRINAEYHT